jgi:hypothetical protein
MSEQEKGRPPGRWYRVVERLLWIEGGKPGARPREWEGGEVVTYEPGDTVYMEDSDLRDGVPLYLEGIDDAGRAVLEEIRKAKAPARQIPVGSLDAEERNDLIWLLTESKAGQEGWKDALIWAIRNGFRLPDDLEFRGWFADVLEGKLDPKRGRGRPPKPETWDLSRVFLEKGIADAYQTWLSRFEHDREWAWLLCEAARIRQEKPDAVLARYNYDIEEEKRAFKAALSELGARRCPPAGRGAETARELAFKATVQEYRKRWKSRTGEKLKESTVARIVTRVNEYEGPADKEPAEQAPRPTRAKKSE